MTSPSHADPQCPATEAAAPATTSTTAAMLAALAFFAVTADTAHADERRRLPADMPPAYVQECASCHVAFPPGLLPAASWSRVMAGLERHYGTDASIDATLKGRIEAWLLAHAGTSRMVGRTPPPEDRITRAPWFERKHRQVQPATWRLPSVKSAANCGACHGGAEQGDYGDRGLRLPEGVSAAQQRAWHD